MKKNVKTFIKEMIPYIIIGFSAALNIHFIKGDKQEYHVQMPNVNIKGFNYAPSGTKGQIQDDNYMQEF